MISLNHNLATFFKDPNKLYMVCGKYLKMSSLNGSDFALW